TCATPRRSIASSPTCSASRPISFRARACPSCRASSRTPWAIATRQRRASDDAGSARPLLRVSSRAARTHSSRRAQPPFLAGRGVRGASPRARRGRAPRRRQMGRDLWRIDSARAARHRRDARAARSVDHRVRAQHARFPQAPPLRAAAVRDAPTLVVFDGYHGFMAVPTALAGSADRAFYLAGGYKYAMAGEGVCFMHCPAGFAPRPRDTGWFAAFGALRGASAGVAYGTDGSRFMGATFDPTGLYRLAAVFDWMQGIALTV